MAQLLKAAQGDPNNIALIASIVFSPQANKGTSSAQANLAPGNYVALDATSRTPPLTTFTITKASSPAKLPTPRPRCPPSSSASAVLAPSTTASLSASPTTASWST